MTKNTRLIPLTQGMHATVDADDYEWLSQWKWFALKARAFHYASRSIRLDSGKLLAMPMHRVIMDAPKGLFVDHVNHNQLDNRRVNLRLCTHHENARNRTSSCNSTSKYLGVSWNKGIQKWSAQIRIDGVKTWLGGFASEIDAAHAYDAAARKHHGEFANPNFQNLEP